MKRLVASPWLARGFEIILGAVFVYASLHKITDPPDFAKMIYHYKITPGELINLIAIYLPWVEIAAGGALILGLAGRRGAAALVGAMLLVFICAIGFNLYRGHPVACGCFEGSAGSPKTPQAMFSEMWWTLARDAGMLLMVAQVLWVRATPAGRPHPQIESAAPSAA